jgi:DNA helicase-2/ATP-dependent DNA helicase PcrA
MILHRSWEGCRNIINLLRNQSPEIDYFEADKQIYDPQRGLLEWIGKLMAYRISDGLNVDPTFNDLCEHWQEILHIHGLSNYEASSLIQRVRLFNALYLSQEFSASVRDWLQSIENLLKLDTLLQTYQREHPDDVEEYKKFKEALQPGGALEDYSLQDLQNRITPDGRLYVGTLHSSKGQQRQVVIIVGAEGLNTTIPERQQENRRLFYVGVTRAEDQLYVIHDGFSFLANQLRNGLTQLENLPVL